MRIYRDRTRGLRRESPLLWLLLATGVANLALAVAALVEGGDAGSVTWVVLTASIVVAILVWLPRARRRDRAAREAAPPLG